MKITQTVNVTREEFTMIKGMYADLLGMFLNKIGRVDDGTYSKLMKDYFGHDINLDIKTKSLLGKTAYTLRLTDTITLDITLELTPAALEKLIRLGFSVAELGMPLAVATYEMANAQDKIKAVKDAHDALNAAAAIGKNEINFDRKPRV